MADTESTVVSLLYRTIAEVYRAPVTDTAAVLLSGWNGFTMLTTATILLVEHWPDPETMPDWYTFVRNHNHTASAVAVQYLEIAPSLPPTDRNPEQVTGWATRDDVSSRIPVPYDIRFLSDDLADAAIEVFGSQMVIDLIPKLGLTLNLALSAGIPHARDPRDRKALAVGVAMSSQICDCWDGKLSTFVSSPKQMKRDAAAAGAHKWSTDELRGDRGLIDLLRRAIADCADTDGWAALPEIGSAIRRLAPDFLCETYGHSGLTRLIKATRLFQIRKGHPRTGGTALYVRDKRPLDAPA